MVPLITLAATDVEGLLDFYEGLHSEFITWGRHRPIPWRAVPSEVQVLGSEYDTPPALRGRLSMLVDDMDGAMAFVKKSGGSVVVSPRMVAGRSMALIRDPAGNSIGFHTWQARP